MENYIGRSQEMANSYRKLLMKSFKFYLNLYGTNCKVKRFTRNASTTPSRDQMISKMYGKANTEDIYEDGNGDVTFFDQKLIINKSSQVEFYNGNTDEITCYLNDDNLDVGDTISYNRFKKNYTFKVDSKFCYEDILFEYKLIGLKDYGINK